MTFLSENCCSKRTQHTKESHNVKGAFSCRKPVYLEKGNGFGLELPIVLYSNFLPLHRKILTLEI